MKQYFPETTVLPGMFRVVETLYGVRIAPARRRCGIRTCAFSTSAIATAQLVGQFYLDLYARAVKRGGAWMDDAITRRRARRRGIQTPVAYLNCNFSAPRRRQAARCSRTTK